MRRTIAPVAVTVFMLGLSAGPAVAHHDGFGELPDRNPHAAGVPGEFWDAGVEAGVLLDEDGDLAPHPDEAPEAFVQDIPFHR